MPENNLFTCIYHDGNYRIMERIIGFTDARTYRKRWIFRTQNMSKRLKNATFSVNSIFVFRTVNASFFCRECYTENTGVNDRSWGSNVIMCRSKSCFIARRINLKEGDEKHSSKKDQKTRTKFKIALLWLEVWGLNSKIWSELIFFEFRNGNSFFQWRGMETPESFGARSSLRPSSCLMSIPRHRAYTALAVKLALFRNLCAID